MPVIAGIIQRSNASQCQTMLEMCKETVQRSPWVPAELAPFLQPAPQVVLIQARVERCKAATLCWFNRNNCILASLHLSPFTTVVWHLTVFLCCKLQYRPRTGESHCSITACSFLFFCYHPHSSGLSRGAEYRWGIEPPLSAIKSVFQQHLAL